VLDPPEGFSIGELMAQAAFHFPRGFLWGTATAAHQVEGGNTNDSWYAWEQQPGKIAEGHKSGLACDWWNGRWREDFQRAAEGGQNAHRLSVEWSRIQPAPERWDESALDRYLEMVRTLKELNMTPMVTLHHFTNPLWLEEQGGWENDTVVELFEQFTRRVVDALKDYVSLWCTLNEPNVYILSGYLDGIWPPGKKDLGALFRVAVNLTRAHAAAYHAIHAIQPQARVGMAINYRSLVPAKAWFLPDRWVSRLLATSFNNTFPCAAKDGVVRFLFKRQRFAGTKGTQDFIGLNYYTRDRVAFNLLKARELFAHRTFRKDALKSPTNFIANEPEGMFEGLKWCGQFKLPIMVTENGVEDPDDRLRPRYLAEHLRQVWRAVNFNWPVKGYFHWSLVDNFEWERGWTQRFGLWKLDEQTQARTRRSSVDFYAEICRENGLSAEMVARYAPDAFAEMFPN
jgi:beta-glucosidase